MSNPFDYVNAINAGKDIIRNSDDFSLSEKDYKSFFVNKALSYHEDTIYASNVMNQYHNLPVLLQNDFYINIIRPRKRFSKWAKAETSERIEIIVQYFGYSYEKAKQVVDLKIISEEDYTAIVEKLQKGGVTNESFRS